MEIIESGGTFLMIIKASEFHNADGLATAADLGDAALCALPQQGLQVSSGPVRALLHLPIGRVQLTAPTSVADESADAALQDGPPEQLSHF